MAIYLSITFLYWFFMCMKTVSRYGHPFGCGVVALIFWLATGCVPVLIFKLVG